MGGVSALSPQNVSTDATVTPPARRAARSSWRDPRLVIGILIVAISVLTGTTLFNSADDAVSVWAARDNLSSGSPVETDDLATREIRFTSAADANRYLSADRPVPADATLLRAVGTGELLPRAALGAGSSGPVTEVPLSVPAEAVPQNVQAGSVVDVWVSPDAAAGGGQKSVRIFEEVKVIAAPTSGSTFAPSGTRQIIIGVDEVADDELARSLATAARGTTVVTKRG